MVDTEHHIVFHEIKIRLAVMEEKIPQLVKIIELCKSLLCKRYCHQYLDIDFRVQKITRKTK